MPHAVSFDRSLTTHSIAQPEHQRYHGHQLLSGWISTNAAPLASKKIGTPTSAWQLAPPPEMNVGVDHGRVHSSYQQQQHSHVHKDVSGYGYRGHAGQQQQHHHAQSTAAASSYVPQRLPHAPVAKAFPSPTSQRSSFSKESTLESGRSSDGGVAPSLRVPSTIRTPQVGIAQLAAEVTCLFWFEDASTLERIELLSITAPIAVSPLVPDATPSVGFRKWVATILSTTQVTQNVILLALLFIYRLKKINPTVKGKPGSEFRLLTVALMLGNKFLDDNTYTNKTWAEVSGISVQEVHIMEVEFLSNMRYSLFTTEPEWMEWHAKLGKFGNYIDAATRALHEQSARQATMNSAGLHAGPTLPSPPASGHASPPYATGTPPRDAIRTSTPSLLPQIGSATISPIGPLPELKLRPTARKRSYDEQAEEPAPKRLSRRVAPPPQLAYSQATSSAALQLPTPQPSVALRAPRLPLPALTIPSAGTHHLSAPPPLPAPGHAMSLVFPPAGPLQHPVGLPPAHHPTTQPYPGGLLNTESITPRQQQGQQLSPYPISGTSSPLSAVGPGMAVGQTRSPSYFLAQRQSPYRPVRQPHMLLVPPPHSTASLQNAPRNMPSAQMQYQPLGRPVTERRAGHLPYMHHEAWPQTHQLNQWPGIAGLPM